MDIQKLLFGRINDKDIYRFNLVNAKGNSISIINYGANIISWKVKDGHGKTRDIVMGFDNLDGYLKNNAYIGCIAGRYANRIANGRFTLYGKEYKLACNNGPNHLHGGNTGFDKVAWDAAIVDDVYPRISLTYTSKDGEEGYPGNLFVKVDYTYTENDELIIDYFAQTDKATPVNLTNHSYFNLTGDAGSGILEHSLQVHADHYTAVDENQIPTGELRKVDKTAFDFNAPGKISRHISKTENGFDHNYVLKQDSNKYSLAAVLTDPENEIQLSVYTTEPGLQFYSGNLLDGSLINRDGKPIGTHAALCLETQHFPDSPNCPGFPSTILLPGETFVSRTMYKITVK
jgi:aldose 1-epimerase